MASSSLLPSAGRSLLPDSPHFRSDQLSFPPKSFISIPNSGLKRSWIRASSAMEKAGVLSDNLDGWMRESVVEIVKSLKKSPLMLHVYCNESTELKPENAWGLENWRDLEKEWRDGERRSPDGIILVQQLEENKIEIVDLEEDKSRETKAWGVLIQGKGGGGGGMGRQTSRTACYLLKTCSVHSGLGLCGTHFTLVKVNNFRDSAFSQFKNSWLL
ncbi:uncharacterized protein LOC141713281 [Apium graveolens]|uniref:uncharacterized protein LOC141713281 n=1 Tax=Apium graveolens TaxID=4045 RepID=UPI003D7B2F71